MNDGGGISAHRRNRWQTHGGIRSCCLSALLVAVLLAATACGGEKKSAHHKPPVVTVAAAMQRDVPIYLNAIGYATAFEDVDIMSQVDGQLLEIHFEQGSAVKKGDLLFSIDPRPYAAALEQARGELQTALANERITGLSVKRHRPLLEPELIAPQAFDSLVAEHRQAVGEVRTARGNVEAAEVNLNYCTIESPLDGVIDIYQVNAGNILFADDRQVLTSIRQVNPIYIDFVISERDLPRVQTYLKESGGQLTMDVAPMTDPKKTTRASMKIVSNKVQRPTGTVRLRGITENADHFFWPGQSLNVRVILRMQKGAITVPRESLQRGQKGYSVFVVNPDKVTERRTVTIGEREGDDTIVRTGIEKGENVVVKGQIAVRPGKKVRILSPDAASKGHEKPQPSKTKPQKPSQ